MKKIVILMGILIVLTGCQEKKENKDTKISTSTTTSLKTSDITTKKVDEQEEGTTIKVGENSNEEAKITTTNSTTTSSKDKKTTTNNQTTTSKTTTKTTKKTTTTSKKTTTTTKKVTTASRLTEKEVYNKMIALKSKYPTGTKYDNSICYEWKGVSSYKGCGCAGFAFMLSDAAFGSAKASKHTDISKIRVGDIIRLYNDTHSVIVLEVASSGVTVAEGNMTVVGAFENGVYWGRKISNDELKSSVNYIYTRW
ncbi:MAG: lipoprotein [Bacilli bacterium]|nr:lipoprotein [Bacilli bacterium]MDE6141234.1 lipoprotein [Bacilli bacterium]